MTVNPDSFSMDKFFAEYGSKCRHSWVAGMNYVDDEDLETIAKERMDKGLDPIECEKCDSIIVLDEEDAARIVTYDHSKEYGGLQEDSWG